MGLDRVARIAATAVLAMSAVLVLARAISFEAGLLIALLALAALGAAEAVIGWRHRTEAERFARAHGWEHLPRTAAYSTRFAGYPFDLPGHVHQEGVLRGSYGGMRCASFTVVVEADELDARRRGPDLRQTFQVTLAELPVTLPRLDIVPENLYHRTAQALGAMDVEVESHAFNERWRVTAHERKYAHDVVDPRMIARLLEHDALGLAIRIDGGAVMVWQQGRQGTATLARRLGVVTGVARRIPAHVLRRFEEEGAAVRDPDAPLQGPDWAITPGALTSRRYTGIGVEDVQPDAELGRADAERGRAPGGPDLGTAGAAR